MKQRIEGFSLIELMIVVAIIIIALAKSITLAITVIAGMLAVSLLSAGIAYI